MACTAVALQRNAYSPQASKHPSVDAFVWLEKKIVYIPKSMQDVLCFISMNLRETHVGMDPKGVKTRT